MGLDIILHRNSAPYNSQENDPVIQGVAWLNDHHPREALNCFERAIAMDPENALAHYNAGVACQTMQADHQAISHYQKAIGLIPDFSPALHNLAQAYTRQKKFKQAIDAYHQALHASPEDFKSAYNLSILYHKTGNAAAAINTCRQAIQAKPDFAEAFSNLGLIYCNQDHFEEAMVCIEQALKINPSLAVAYHNRGVILQKCGHYERGLDAYRKSLACEPDYAPARWLSMLSLPMLYDSAEQIKHYRQQFRHNLNQLIDTTPLETKAQRQYALKGIQTTTNFYLQYQGGNDLELQQKYGHFVHRVMAANYPQWTQPKPMPILKPARKIRIGYVSTFMCQHTVGTYLAGWVANHHQEAFDIHCYHMGIQIDAMTSHFRNISHHFHWFAGDVEAAAQQIETDQLHILVYSDIGMDPATLQLAALRLAPIQCKGWGHPVTTGLPTVDYYLSSDLMEPPHADRYYSETLVRLPNLALYCTPPQLPRFPKGRQAFGLPQHRFIFLSTQSVFKYLPQYDDIYAHIARQVPQAYFVFISNQSSSATHRFLQRLRTSFQQYDLDPDQFCHFSPRLSYDDFLSLNMAADVLLDTFDWSGGKTTLEALSCGLPVVTCPGKFMRGRHAHAMLKRIGISETIATDKSSYVQIAVRLALEPDYYTLIRRQIEGGRDKLYEDRELITHLENFYRFIVENHGSI